MIVVLAGGRIAEWGTHEALLEKNGIYAKLVEYPPPPSAGNSGAVGHLLLNVVGDAQL